MLPLPLIGLAKPMLPPPTLPRGAEEDGAGAVLEQLSRLATLLHTALSAPGGSSVLDPPNRVMVDPSDATVVLLLFVVLGTGDDAVDMRLW